MLAITWIFFFLSLFDDLTLCEWVTLTTTSTICTDIYRHGCVHDSLFHPPGHLWGIIYTRLSASVTMITSGIEHPTRRSCWGRKRRWREWHLSDHGYSDRQRCHFWHFYDFYNFSKSFRLDKIFKSWRNMDFNRKFSKIPFLDPKRPQGAIEIPQDHEN